MVWPAVIAAGAQLAGGAVSAYGQRKANQRNIELAREQMAFQERMSSTAYQRAARDLESAGLNRILSLGDSASTPTGQTAQMQNPTAELGRAVGKTAASAMAMKTAIQNIDNMRAVEQRDNYASKLSQGQWEKVEAEKNLLDAALPGAQAEANFWQKLEAGDFGGTAKGIQWIAPLLRMLRK